jgi:hypothetical protein
VERTDIGSSTRRKFLPRHSNKSDSEEYRNWDLINNFMMKVMIARQDEDWLRQLLMIVKVGFIYAKGKQSVDRICSFTVETKIFLKKIIIIINVKMESL